MIVRFRRTVGAGLAVIILAVVAACAPTYNEQTDKDISNLQRKVDQKIVTLVSLSRKVATLQRQSAPVDQKSLAQAMKDASYDSNSSFYDDVDSELTTAQMEVDASPDASTPKIDQTFVAVRAVLIDDPQGNVPSSMRAVHAAQGRLGEAFLRSTRAQTNVLFATLIQYESTIKAGKTPSK